MGSYTPCAGSGQNAVELKHYQGAPPGLGSSPSPARTFGKCPACGRTVAERGYALRVKVNRHKATVPDDAPVYVADPANPTDAEIEAAIQRGLANGSLIDADEWMARHAAELGR